MLTGHEMNSRKGEQGFTLIELSIVLVIIGLIVGGVLVGQDLIRAAEVRATIAQIEKYNTAVNTFRGKYNAIPGDMNAATSLAFGVGKTNRNGGTARGDGNGVIDAYNTAAVQNPSNVLGGETAMFWNDLGSANLVDGGFGVDNIDAAAATAPSITLALPGAKLGRGNYVVVYSNGGINYYGLIAISAIVNTTGAYTLSNSGKGLTNMQAYNIDKKVDDGIASTGSVTATAFTTASPAANATATSGDCYENTTNTYNVGAATSSGSEVDCSLGFRFQ